MTGGEQHGEAAAHAESDHTGPPGATLRSGEPVSGDIEVAEDRPAATRSIAHHRRQTARPGPAPVEVGDQGQVSIPGQPVRLIPGVIGHPTGIEDDDDAGPWPRSWRRGQVPGQLASRRGNLDLPHRLPRDVSRVECNPLATGAASSAGRPGAPSPVRSGIDGGCFGILCLAKRVGCCGQRPWIASCRRRGASWRPPTDRLRG